MDISLSPAWPRNTSDVRRQRHYWIVALAAAIAIHMLAVVAVLFLQTKPIILQSGAANRGLRVTLTTAMRPTPVTPAPAPPRVSQRSPHAPKTAAVLASRRPGTRTVVVAPTRPADAADAAPPEKPPAEPATPPVAVAERPTGPPAEPASASPSLNLPGSQTVMDVAHVECNIPQPDYPPRARRLQHAGSVTISVTIGTAGQIAQVAIARTSGFDELDAAAREAMLAARCKPYLDHGVAVAVHALQPIDFDLKN